MDEDELTARLSEPRAAFTKATITEPEAIRTRLPRVREQGWAASIDELEIGLTTVPRPCLKPAPTRTSLSGCPTFRFGAGRIELAAATVQTAAAAVAAALHNRRSDAGR
jgi:DNA-binding IclR family transcriptional regulator